MDLIERRIDFDGGKAAGIPREMGAVYSGIDASHGAARSTPRNRRI
jgi:hypothetical protein